MKEKRTIWIKLFVLAGILAMIFLVANLIWYVGIKTRYDKMEKRLDNCDRVIAFGTEDVGALYDGCVVTMKQTSYLQNSGFVSMTDIKEYEYIISFDESLLAEDDEKVITLYFWPELFGEDVYGVDISCEDYWEQIHIDKNGNYAPLEKVDSEVEEYMEGLLDEHKEEIGKLLAKMRKFLEECEEL